MKNFTQQTEKNFHLINLIFKFKNMEARHHISTLHTKFPAIYRDTLECHIVDFLRFNLIFPLACFF